MKVFMRQKSGLNAHKASVHHKKVFKCEICDAKLVSNENLKNHTVNVHEKRKPYICEICNASFGIKQDKKKHMLSKHKD